MVIPRFWGIFLLSMGSFALPGRSEFLENVEYGRAGDVNLRMDARIPVGPGPFPAAIIVHGGGWVRGDRKHTVEPLFKPLADARFATFSISYRLAGDLNSGSGNAIGAALMLGAAIDDVRQAVTFVKAHAEEYRIDPNRVALIGESAGAQLASMAALKPGPNGEVRAVVAMYSPSDLVSLAQTSKQIPGSVREAVRGTPFAVMLLAGLRNLSPNQLRAAGHAAIPAHPRHNGYTRAIRAIGEDVPEDPRGRRLLRVVPGEGWRAWAALVGVGALDRLQAPLGGVARKPTLRAVTRRSPESSDVSEIKLHRPNSAHLLLG